MRRRALLLVAMGAFVAASGAASAQGLSPVVEQTEALFAIVLTLALLVGLVVYGTLAIALVRFRASRSAGTPHPMEGNRGLEAAWSAVPALLLVGLTIVSTQTLLFIEANPRNVPEIRVIGQQWSWTFGYPDGRNSSELWLERGVTFLFNITSKDVVHSFYLPEFQVKKDAVPGLSNYLWLRPDRAGEFRTVCAEFCGLGHNGMIANFIVFEHQTGRPPYGPPPVAPPSPTSVGVTLEELGPSSFAIRPSMLNFTLNDYVRLRVRNNGTAAHTFRIDDPYNVTTGPIPPGSTRDLFLNLTNETPGTLYGGGPGERANGMVGTLVVKAGQVIDIWLSGGGTTPFRITPAVIRRSLNDVITFRIRNNATDLVHNFTLAKPYEYVKWDPPIPPGETVTLGPVVLDKEAKVEYICHIPGHKEQGMRGDLIVGNPKETVQITYPVLDFAVTTFFIGGVAGVGYVLHHARAGDAAGRRNRER